jgi:hypothetical protein
MRLRELIIEGIIAKAESRKSKKFVRWNLTEKGWDVLPILMTYTAFGAKWFAPSVFPDGEPREMREIYPQRSLRKSYVNIDVDKEELRRLQATNVRAKAWSER